MSHAESPDVRQAAVVRKYQDTGKKLYMTMDEAVALSLELADRLRVCDPRPEVVVGIANGALMMARLISERLGLPARTLRIRRRGSVLKQWLSRIPGVRAVGSFLYGMPVARLPLSYAFRRLSGIHNGAKRSEGLLVSGKVVALVDDCIGSGQTVVLANEILSAAQAKAVVVACISWSGTEDRHGVTPDTHISRRMHHYPWSMNSPYWQEYVSWLAANGISLVKS